MARSAAGQVAVLIEGNVGQVPTSVAGEEVLFVARGVVQANATLLAIRAGTHCSRVVIACSRGVGQRIVLEHIQDCISCRVETGRTDYVQDAVARELLTCDGVVGVAGQN